MLGVWNCLVICLLDGFWVGDLLRPPGLQFPEMPWWVVLLLGAYSCLKSTSCFCEDQNGVMNNPGVPWCPG